MLTSTITFKTGFSIEKPIKMGDKLKEKNLCYTFGPIYLFLLARFGFKDVQGSALSCNEIFLSWTPPPLPPTLMLIFI